MKSLKKYLGVVWIVLGPAAIVFMIWQAVEKIHLANAQVSLASGEAAQALARANATNTILQWCIIIAVFLPIASGMVIFGRYALAGEYDRLPENSMDV